MQVAQFASQKMETKVPKLAIIAGNGSIPFYLIEECENNWCYVSTENFRGWIVKDNLWGM